MARLSIAQIFSTDGTYVPAKASIHLRNAGESLKAFEVSDSSVIDAANFYQLKQKDIFIRFDDSENDATGSGCVWADSPSPLSVSTDNAPTCTYPIKCTTDGLFHVYFRVKGTGTVNVNLNGTDVTEFTPDDSNWHWKSVNIVIPDKFIHYLQIKPRTSGVKIDKIIISKTSMTPSGTGPDYSIAPFITLHGRLSTSLSGFPQTYLPQHAYLTTVDSVSKEGWYNFELSTFSGYAQPSGSDFAFVLTASGSSDLRYVMWDVADEVTNPIANFSDGAWTTDSDSSMAIQIYASLDALDEYGCYISTPNATLEDFTQNDFDNPKNDPVHENTVTVINEYNSNDDDVELDVSEKLLSIVIDQSGSNTWNDNKGLRHAFALGVVDALERRYPSDVRMNLLKLNSEPAFSFFVPLPRRVDSNHVGDIIRESFRGKPENFAGFRVVRNPDRYPETAIDGEIVMDGYGLAALDKGLEQDKQYYYTVYTYDHFDRFSKGVQLPVRTGVIDAPRGIPTFEIDVIRNFDIERDENIVGMWNMDEGDGDWVYDFSDSEIALRIENVRWLARFDCPTGVNGLRFNGFNSHAHSIPTSDVAFHAQTSFSVMGWAYPFAENGESTIIAKSSSSGFDWAVGQDGLKLMLKIGQTETISVSGDTDLTEEEWSHFAVTFEHSSTPWALEPGDTNISTSGGGAGYVKVTFYINGEKDISRTFEVPAGFDSASTLPINLGFDPSSTVVNRYFGKLSHIHAHNIGRSSSYVASASEPRQRFTPREGIREPADNGDRLVMASFDIPEDYNYNLIRIVRNQTRMPYHESDGDIVLEISPITGRQSYGLSDDYDVDSDYWFRIFTQNALGNWCPIEDSIGHKVHIPDHERPKIRVSCGAGCVAEINPGPGFGSCPTPNVLEVRGGNQKNYIKWEPPSNSDCTLVKIYRRSEKYVVFDNTTKWISDADNEYAVEPIFVGPSSLGEFVHRNLQNREPSYYTIVFTDRLGRHSDLGHLEVVYPQEGVDESGIPLLEALNVSYHKDDFDIVRISWDSPVEINSYNEGWFDDRFYFYGAVCNLYGEPLPIDFPDGIDIVTSVVGSSRESVEDVFNTYTGEDTVNRIPKTTFSTNLSGLITGTVSLRSSPIFSVLSSLTLGISANYVYSDNFEWTFPSSRVMFKNPLEMRLINRDNLRLNTGDFVNPACTNPQSSGGSDKDKTASQYRVNGCFIRRKQPFTARAIFTYKGNPIQNATITAKIFDAKGGPCGISVDNFRTTSRTLTFQRRTFEVKTGTLPVIDSNGNFTGISEVQSYADIPINVPNLPQSGALYVRVQSKAFQSVKDMQMFFPSTLRISLSATAPLGNGSDVREQFARAWFVDPDFPSDPTKNQVVPDLSVMRWSLTKGGSSVRNVPFYSTDSVPLVNGVYSYTRSGTARNIFFGPAQSGSQGTYNLKATISVDGLIASQEASLEIKVPGQGDFDFDIPEPTAPRIFAEMDECINYLWADGEDYVKMRIFRQPGDPTKTLVPDEVNGGMRQAKYAEKFRECSVDNDGNSTLFPLPIGTTVTVEAPGYEIIWGTVTEFDDEDTGLKWLGTEDAFNALDTADIELGRPNYTEVYFRRTEEVDPKGCRDITVLNCNCFDLADRICDEPNVIGDITGVRTKTTINLAGKPIQIFGGGNVGDDNVSRPPTALVPREPLSFELVGIFIDGNLVDRIVVDGETSNQVVFEMKYRNMAVPAGVPVEVFLTVVVNGEVVEEIDGINKHTYLGIPRTIYTYNTTDYPGINDASNTTVYSFCSITMNPIPTNNNIAIGIGVSTDYNGVLTSGGTSSSSSSGGI